MGSFYPLRETDLPRNLGDSGVTMSYPQWRSLGRQGPATKKSHSSVFAMGPDSKDVQKISNF